ncbi:hypothetical protein B0J14DRAFT_651181 [Halenospora varia]|nr:hypothetical protein B0J14DRAFT_651181 [Halenospora varia]
MFYNFLIQCALMAVAMAAPLSGHHGKVEPSNTWEIGASGGVLALIVLILDLLVCRDVVKSDRPVAHKALWCVADFLLPILGVVGYWLFSNREAHKPTGEYEAIA